MRPAHRSPTHSLHPLVAPALSPPSLPRAAPRAQQKAVFKTVLLAKKMEVLAGQAEKKDAQLAEVLKASNLEPGALGPVERRLEDILTAKNQTIGRAAPH
jgi:hypothetical protein